MNIGRRAFFAGSLAFTATGATANHPLVNILFVGNSFTIQHDIPGMVMYLASRSTSELIITSASAKYGAYLADVADDAAALLAEHDPFGLVLQDHSLAAMTPERRRASLQAIRAFRVHSGPVTLFAPWPRRAGHPLYGRPGMPRTPAEMVERTEGHLFEAARFDRSRTPARVAPVGRAWLLADDLDLYADDGYHANISGAWLSALVLIRTIGYSPFEPIPPEGVAESERLAEIAMVVVP